MDQVPAPALNVPEISFLPATLPSGDLFQYGLYFIGLVYIVFTGVLFYHWHAYADDKKVALATYVAYLVITIPMMLTLIGSAVIM